MAAGVDDREKKSSFAEDTLPVLQRYKSMSINEWHVAMTRRYALNPAVLQLRRHYYLVDPGKSLATKPTALVNAPKWPRLPRPYPPRPGHYLRAQ
jgi:hypothetical protein